MTLVAMPVTACTKQGPNLIKSKPTTGAVFTVGPDNHVRAYSVRLGAIHELGHKCDNVFSV